MFRLRVAPGGGPQSMRGRLLWYCMCCRHPSVHIDMVTTPLAALLPASLVVWPLRLPQRVEYSGVLCDASIYTKPPPLHL